MPHIVGKYPNPGFIDNPQWHALVDEVARAKTAGARIYGSLASLRTIRGFTRFECYPTTRPMVYPNGDLLYPCGPLQKKAGNLLEIGDYFKAVEIGLEKHGPVPYCDARCHLGCFMEASLAITDPAGGIMEALRYFLRPPASPASAGPSARAWTCRLPSTRCGRCRRCRRMRSASFAAPGASRTTSAR